MLFKNLIVLSVLMTSFSAQAIVSGRKPDPLKSASTVSIHVEGADHLVCSGVIISAHLILTAGHCLDGASKNASTVSVTNAIDAEGRLKELHLAAPFGRDPLYTEPSSSGVKKAADIQYDFSYLKISEDLLTTFGLSEQQLPRLFAQTADVDTALSSSNVAVAYGYGLLDRPAPVDLDPGRSNIKKELNMTVTHESTLHTLVARSSEKNKGLCNGDSGGGLFLTAPNAQVYLAGIVSGIAGVCGGSNSYAVYSIVNEHICWVFKNSATPAPPELSDCNSP